MCEQLCLSVVLIKSQSSRWIVLDVGGNKAKRAEDHIEGRSNSTFESIPATYLFSLKATFSVKKKKIRLNDKWTADKTRFSPPLIEMLPVIKTERKMHKCCVKQQRARASSIDSTDDWICYEETCFSTVTIYSRDLCSQSKRRGGVHWCQNKLWMIRHWFLHRSIYVRNLPWVEVFTIGKQLMMTIIFSCLTE